METQKEDMDKGMKKITWKGKEQDIEERMKIKSKIKQKINKYKKQQAKRQFI